MAIEAGSNGSAAMSIEEIMNKVDSQDDEEHENEQHMNMMDPPQHLYLSPLAVMPQQENNSFLGIQPDDIGVEHLVQGEASVGVSTLNDKFE